MDLSDDDDRRWLEACVWPDHPERSLRLTAAIELHQRNPVRLVAGDAVTDLPALIDQAPADHDLVVMTSWAAYYLSPEQRRDFESVMASSTRAISWISAEHPSVVSDLHNTQAPKSESPDIARIGVVHYPGRGSISDRQFVGWSHNHGAWIDWPIPGSPATT